MHEQPPLSRRQFLKHASCGLGLALGASSLLGWPAWGASGAMVPNERIALGCIGVGGMGTANLQGFLGESDVQIVAVCDVDRAHRENARQLVDAGYTQAYGRSYKGCAAYGDFRELLARPEIDAVMIATPDHWHAPIACAAARAGKDIYCEKPLALTIMQGRLLSDTMERYGRVFQTGSWQRSDSNFRLATELVRNGRLGQLHTIQVGLPGGAAIGPQPEMPVPAGFDYDLWLGPAPWVPYTERRCHYNFRFNFDYSGGKVTDWGAHHLDIAHWAMGMDHSGPTEVEGQGEFPRDGIYNTATNFRFTATYANGVKVIASNKLENGLRFEGSEGWLFISRERLDAQPRSLLRSAIAPGEVRLYRSPGHYANFLECVRTRGETVAPAEVAHRSITVAHLANIAMRLERKVRWDPEREHFLNDPEAERMLTRAMRGPWQL